MSQKSDFQLSEGVEVEELSGELYEKFCSQMKSFALGFIKLQPYNQMLPRCFLQYQKQIKEFQSRPDDVWVASFPKCGKTAMFLIPHCSSHKNVVQNSRVTFNSN